MTFRGATLSRRQAVFAAVQQLASPVCYFPSHHVPSCKARRLIPMCPPLQGPPAVGNLVNSNLGNQHLVGECARAAQPYNP